MHTRGVLVQSGNRDGAFCAEGLPDTGIQCQSYTLLGIQFRNPMPAAFKDSGQALVGLLIDGSGSTVRDGDRLPGDVTGANL